MRGVVEVEELAHAVFRVYLVDELGVVRVHAFVIRVLRLFDVLRLDLLENQILVVFRESRHGADGLLVRKNVLDILAALVIGFELRENPLLLHVL